MSKRSEPGLSALAQGITLALCAISTLGFELAIHGPQHPEWISVLCALAWMTVVLVGIALGRGWVAPSRSQGESLPRPARLPKAARMAMLAALLILPFLAHAARFTWQSRGWAIETPLLESLRNLGLVLAMVSHVGLHARLSAVVSLFGVLVAASLVDGRWATAVLVGFGLVGTVWLMALYWLTGPARWDQSSRYPILAMCLVLAVLGAGVGVAAVGPREAGLILGNWMPTSGGTEWLDPDAQGGVNDGPNEVSAQQKPQGVGFTQSEIYLETDQPSLYDSFNETYGEPPKPRDFQRAMAVAPSQSPQREHPAESLRAGREFSTARRAPRPRPLSNLDTKALLYVKGRTPLHIRQAVYDHFDGRDWTESDRSKQGWSPIHRESMQTSWLKIDTHRAEWHVGVVDHRFKLARLETQVLPAAPHVHRFKLGSVHDRDFYHYGLDQVLRMKERSIPPGSVIESSSWTVDPARLRNYQVLEVGHGVQPTWNEDPIPAEVAELARAWTRDLTPGWTRVDAVIDHLRRGYRHDRSATIAEHEASGRHPVVVFLRERQSGPDYLFATSAVLMLRSLGLVARLASGFYASPDDYQRAQRHTPIHHTNAHVWAEVMVSPGSWVILEPTPGYEVMGPEPGLAQFLTRWLTEFLRWGRDHSTSLTLISLCLAIAAWRRRDLQDLALRLLWSLVWSRARETRSVVLATLRMLEHRARWAGCPRPLGTTPSQWYGRLATRADNDARSDLSRLIVLADWCLHAPSAPPTDPEARTRLLSTDSNVYRALNVSGHTLVPPASGGSRDWVTLCQRVNQRWNLAHLRALRQGGPKSSNKDNLS